MRASQEDQAQGGRLISGCIPIWIWPLWPPASPNVPIAFFFFTLFIDRFRAQRHSTERRSKLRKLRG